MLSKGDPMRVFAVLLVAVSFSCGTDEPTSSETSAELRGHDDDPNSVLFPKDARPFGRSMARWNELIWQWIVSQPAAHNPLLDQSGADCAVDHQGPVWFLASVVPNGRPFVAARSCTIPRQKALLVQISSILNDYPCPDPNFQPAPGQTLYEFLLAGAMAFIDTVNLIEVSLDGVPLRDILDFRSTSENLF